MKRARGVQAGPPRVDRGETAHLGEVLAGFLRPTPGRWRNTLRMTGIVVLILILAETFRIPDPAVSGYMAIIFFAADETANLKLAKLGGIVVTGSVMVAVALLMVDLSQPALRLPLIALSTFTVAFVSRRVKIGFLVVAGLFIVSVQTDGDSVLKGSLSPGTIANTTSGALPEIAFMPPEEALLHNVLWSLCGFVFPIVIVFVVNRLVGRPASEKLRQALAERLRTAAAFCRGEPGSRETLVKAARSGTPAIVAQNDLAASFERGRYDPNAGRRLIDGVARLLLVLVAWRRLPEGAAETTPLRAAAPTCAALAARLSGAGRGATTMAGDLPPTAPDTGTSHGPIAPLAASLDAALRQIRSVLDGGPDPAPPALAPAKAEGGATPDPGPVRFGLKLTLAVMSCYLFMSLSDWSAISTCLTTCFVLASDSLGQSFHKLVLRVAGAVAGGIVGFVAVLVVMPLLTDIGDLLLLVTPVLLAFGWIRAGSERVSYFGQQGAFAFLLVVVQDFGPTLDFQAGRNRVIGILVGELAMFLVFSRIWPERVGDIVRASLSEALTTLADLLGGRAKGREADANRRFDAAIAKVRTILPDDRYEAPVRPRDARKVIDAATLDRVQALIVPVSILAAERGSTPDKQEARTAALTRWLDDCSTWVRTGRDVTILAHSLGDRSADEPDRPASSDARTFWLDVLEADLRALLEDVLRASDARPEPRAQGDGTVALGAAAT